MNFPRPFIRVEGVQSKERWQYEKKVTDLLKDVDIDAEIEKIINELRTDHEEKGEEKGEDKDGNIVTSWIPVFTSGNCSIKEYVREVCFLLADQLAKILESKGMEYKKVKQFLNSVNGSLCCIDYIEIIQRLYPIAEARPNVFEDAQYSLMELVLICHGISPHINLDNTQRGILRNETGSTITNVGVFCNDDLKNTNNVTEAFNRIDMAMQSGKLRVNSGDLVRDSWIDTRKVIFSDFIEWAKRQDMPLGSYIHEDTKKMFKIVDSADLLKENNELKEKIKKLEKQVQSSPRATDEKMMAYFFLDKIKELEGNKDWKEAMKNNAQKGAILQKMESLNIKIDAKSFEDSLKRACKRYLESNKKK